jgi:hypothetical protein
MSVEAGMKQILVLMTMAALTASVQEFASPQQQVTSPNPSQGEPAQYVYEVWGMSNLEPDRERPWSDPCYTLAEAEDRLEELKHDHYSKDGLLRTSPEHPANLVIKKHLKPNSREKGVVEAGKFEGKLSEAKEVKDAEEKRLMAVLAKERALAATIKEYGQEVMKAYDKARQVKDGMSGLTTKVAKKDFDHANKVIANYNQSRVNFGRAEREFLALQNDRIKNIPKKGKSRGEIPVTVIPTQQNPAFLDQFPAISALKANDFKDRIETEGSPELIGKVINGPRTGFEYFDTERNGTGHFTKGTNNTWTNLDAVGVVYTFVERVRTDDYVQMFDRTRNMWMVFFNDGRSYWKTDQDWVAWYEIKWNQAR